MIQVETAQVVLIRLALAAVLADNQTRYSLQNFSRPEEWPIFQLIKENTAPCTIAD